MSERDGLPQGLISAVPYQRIEVDVPQRPSSTHQNGDQGMAIYHVMFNAYTLKGRTGYQLGLNSSTPVRSNLIRSPRLVANIYEET